MSEVYTIKKTNLLVIVGILSVLAILILLDSYQIYAATTSPSSCPSGSTQPSGSGSKCNPSTEIMCQGEGQSSCWMMTICCNKKTEQCGHSPFGTGFPECHARCNANQTQCSTTLCCDSKTEVCATDEIGEKYCKKTDCGNKNKTTCAGTGDYADEYACCNPDTEKCATSTDPRMKGNPYCAIKCSAGQTFCKGTGFYDDSTICCNTNQDCVVNNPGSEFGSAPSCVSKCTNGTIVCDNLRTNPVTRACCDAATQKCERSDYNMVGTCVAK